MCVFVALFPTARHKNKINESRKITTLSFQLVGSSSHRVVDLGVVRVLLLHLVVVLLLLPALILVQRLQVLPPVVLLHHLVLLELLVPLLVKVLQVVSGLENKAVYTCMSP